MNNESSRLFLGNLDSGDSFGTFTIVGNFQQRWQADAVATATKALGGEMKGYNNGKYECGWVVFVKALTPADPLDKLQVGQTFVKYNLYSLTSTGKWVLICRTSTNSPSAASEELHRVADRHRIVHSHRTTHYQIVRADCVVEEVFA